MIQLNTKYETIFDVRNIDQDCDKIAELMSDEARLIRETLNAGLWKRAVEMYLQLMKSMCKHFVEDEHYCYFDDMYIPEYVLQGLFEYFQMHDLGTEANMLLKEGHDEILEMECYQDYGYPSYIMI